MAKSTVYKAGGETGDVSVNLTPMIDVVFQLIIFFILATQMASKEISPLALPYPHEGKVILEQEIKEWKVVVNVLSKEDPRYNEDGEQVYPGELARYEIMQEQISGPEAGGELQKIIESHYALAKEQKEKFHVEIRADYRVAYQHVAAAMAAAGRADVKEAFIGVSLNPVETGGK